MKITMEIMKEALITAQKYYMVPEYDDVIYWYNKEKDELDRIKFEDNNGNPLSCNDVAKMYGVPATLVYKLHRQGKSFDEMSKDFS